MRSRWLTPFIQCTKKLETWMPWKIRIVYVSKAYSKLERRFGLIAESRIIYGRTLCYSYTQIIQINTLCTIPTAISAFRDIWYQLATMKTLIWSTKTVDVAIVGVDERQTDKLERHRRDTWKFSSRTRSGQECQRTVVRQSVSQCSFVSILSRVVYSWFSLFLSLVSLDCTTFPH